MAHFVTTINVFETNQLPFLGAEIKIETCNHAMQNQNEKIKFMQTKAFGSNNIYEK